jgi:DNA mismatch endonuclease, patch repair protein
MRAVRSRNTTPELAVRKILTALGYRYRLHRRDIPGHPDIAFVRKRKAIFVHGCFWHGHNCKRGARSPKANAEYWRSKISRNRERDITHAEDLNRSGWLRLVVWECELRDIDALRQKLLDFLSG